MLIEEMDSPLDGTLIQFELSILYNAFQWSNKGNSIQICCAERLLLQAPGYLSFS